MSEYNKPKINKLITIELNTEQVEVFLNILGIADDLFIG